MQGFLSKVGYFALVMIPAMIIAFVVVFYEGAFETGARIWFDWQGWTVLAAFIAILVFLPGLGVLPVVVIAGYGAIYGWGWPWWLAVIVFFPGIPIALATLMWHLISGLFARSQS